MRAPPALICATPDAELHLLDGGHCCWKRTAVVYVRDFLGRVHV
jgi:hypothetical protein